MRVCTQNSMDKRVLIPTKEVWRTGWEVPWRSSDLNLRCFVPFSERDTHSWAVSAVHVLKIHAEVVEISMDGAHQFPPLSKQEVVDKLDQVPVFNLVVLPDERIFPIPDQHGEQAIRWFAACKQPLN